MIEQVLGFTSSSGTVLAGPNNEGGTGGTSSITIDSTPGGSSGFANPLTGTTYNTNAPNRAYVDGTAVYCAQANANFTTKIEDCTTGASGSSSLSYPTKALLTGDPIVPATAYDTEAGDGITSGLVAPDGMWVCCPRIRVHPAARPS